MGHPNAYVVFKLAMLASSASSSQVYTAGAEHWGPLPAAVAGAGGGVHGVAAVCAGGQLHAAAHQAEPPVQRLLTAPVPVGSRKQLCLQPQPMARDCSLPAIHLRCCQQHRLAPGA